MATSHDFADVVAAARKAAGNSPLECGKVQRRASGANQANRANFFDALNGYDWTRGVEQHFHPCEWIWN
jgi:hypothetical protein